MTVAELIEQLKDQPQDALVVMSRDPEGNGFSPLHELSAGESYEDGEVTAQEDNPSAPECITMWPE